jgi:hypothetical protein
LELRATIAATLLILALPSATWAGGPWAEGKGRGYVETSALFNLLNENLDHTYQVYAEAGLLEKLTLKLVVPLKYVGSPDNLDVSQFEKGKLFGISNINVGLKYEFFKKAAVLSAGMDAEMRTVNAYDEFGLRTGYEKFTFRPVFAAGWGTEMVYAYGELKPGFSTNGFGHELGFVTEVGGKVDENVWLAFYFEIRGVFRNGDFNDRDAAAYAATGFFRDQQNYFTTGVKFAADLHKGFGINFGAFYGSGVNQPESSGGILALKAGLFYDW